MVQNYNEALAEINAIPEHDYDQLNDSFLSWKQAIEQAFVPASLDPELEMNRAQVTNIIQNAYQHGRAYLDQMNTNMDGLELLFQACMNGIQSATTTLEVWSAYEYAKSQLVLFPIMSINIDGLKIDLSTMLMNYYLNQSIWWKSTIPSLDTVEQYSNDILAASNVFFVTILFQEGMNMIDMRLLEPTRLYYQSEINRIAAELRPTLPPDQVVALDQRATFNINRILDEWVLYLIAAYFNDFMEFVNTLNPVDMSTMIQFAITQLFEKTNQWMSTATPESQIQLVLVRDEYVTHIQNSVNVDELNTWISMAEIDLYLAYVVNPEIALLEQQRTEQLMFLDEVYLKLSDDPRSSAKSGQFESVVRVLSKRLDFGYEFDGNEFRLGEHAS
ncbi:MAG: hypothetical protein MZU97_01105 [Bacillus subtilis]|nr:hypothetical protein [Bacillus subtilis]